MRESAKVGSVVDVEVALWGGESGRGLAYAYLVVEELGVEHERENENVLVALRAAYEVAAVLVAKVLEDLFGNLGIKIKNYSRSKKKRDRETRVIHLASHCCFVEKFLDFNLGFRWNIILFKYQQKSTN